MSKWLPVFLCCFAANAFASSADSGRCPWKMPFTIIISGFGETQGSARTWIPKSGSYVQDDSNYFIPSSTSSYQITIDISLHTKQYSLQNDTLRFSQIIPGYNELQSVMITFAPGKDSIISLTILDSDAYNALTQDYSYIQNFQISSLFFNDTTIFANDSSFVHHKISFTSQKLETVPVNYDLTDYQETFFIASSATLSGIFRPMHFSDPSSIVETPGSPTDALSVISFNHSLRCSFGASAEGRVLEIYSSLGIRTASCSISPGQTEMIIPRVAPGFYFVRLGNSLAKVFVAE